MFKLENENKIDYNLQAYYPRVAANRWLAMRLELIGNFAIFAAAIFAIVDSEKTNAGP